jgi:hypothetical protein
MAILHDQGRHPLTVSPLFPASLSVCFVAPSAACDESAGAVIDANDGLQAQRGAGRWRALTASQEGRP